MENIVEMLFAVIPPAWRKPVKFLGFCAVIVSATLYCRTWIDAKAAERIDSRVTPMELQIVQLEAVVEATFDGQEELRMKADPHAKPRNIRDIKRQALKDAYERRQLEQQIPTSLANPGP